MLLRLSFQRAFFTPERVKQARLLGIDVTDTLPTVAYVDRLFMQANQRLYLLSLLQSSGLQRSSLHLLFNALVINKLTYVLPAYPGQLTVDDKNRINAISRKAMRRGLTLTAFDIDTYRQVTSQTLSMLGH